MLYLKDVKFNEDEYIVPPEFKYFSYDLPEDSSDDYPQRINLSGTIDINELPDLFIVRLLELLPSLSSKILSFTCKTMYIETLNLRGIEVEYIDYDEFKMHDGHPRFKRREVKLGITSSGRLSGPAALIPIKFYPYLNVHGCIAVGNITPFGFFWRPDYNKRYSFFFSDKELSPLYKTERLYARYTFLYDLDSIFQFLKPHLRIVYLDLHLELIHDPIYDNYVTIRFLDKILQHVMNVDEFVIYFSYISTIDNFPIEIVVNLVKNWIKTKPVKLKKLIFHIQDHTFYLIDDQLMLLHMEYGEPFDKGYLSTNYTGGIKFYQTVYYWIEYFKKFGEIEGYRVDFMRNPYHVDK